MSWRSSSSLLRSLTNQDSCIATDRAAVRALSIGVIFPGCSLCRPDLDARSLHGAAAFKPKGDPAAEGRKTDEIAQLGRAPDGRAIDGLDDIALQQSGLLRRRAVRDLGDHRTSITFPGGNVGCEIAHGNADPAPANLAILNQLLHHPSSHVDRYGEPDSDIAAARGNDRGVDADQFSPQIDQGTARISGIDRCIGLDEVFIALLAKAGPSEQR